MDKQIQRTLEKMPLTDEHKLEINRRAVSKYSKKNRVSIPLCLNRKTDGDILTQLEVVKLNGEEGVNTYIKRLIREDIDKLFCRDN